MKRYKVTYKGFVYVEANSKEEALRQAQDGADEGGMRSWEDVVAPEDFFFERQNGPPYDDDPRPPLRIRRRHLQGNAGRRI